MLKYIYQGRVAQFHQQNPEAGEDATFNMHLPASFLGSRSWTSEETGDSLVLARHARCSLQ